MPKISLANKLTFARIFIAPIAIAVYLFMKFDDEHYLNFWIFALICGIAEFTDLFDGIVARARNEVSDFGKLADPFCDVFYRIALLWVLILPIGGMGYAPCFPEDFLGGMFDNLIFPLKFTINGEERIGCMPFLPVLLMTLREIVAGAIRSIAASKGLALAARGSGKIKATFQGAAIISVVGWTCLTTVIEPWQMYITYAFCLIGLVLSVYSIIQYIYINRKLLASTLSS